MPLVLTDRNLGAIAMTHDSNLEKELYNDALALPPEKREAFLLGACRDNDDLRRKVEALLGALPDSTESSNREEVPIRLNESAVIGRYKILQEIDR